MFRKTAMSSIMLFLLTASPAFSQLAGSTELVEVTAGPFIMGSERPERETAYKLDEAAYGHSVTRERGWYEREPRETVELDTFGIQKTPVTNEAYAGFLADTDHPPPSVTRRVWDGYGLIHPFSRAEPHIWRATEPPDRRSNHPVVMVSYNDAVAYSEWLSDQTGETWRLPTEAEWEKAARGTDSRLFPWGNTFDPGKLNSHDAGPFSTVPVGSFPEGASPYGMLDAASQVFEWTATSAGDGRHLVKGGSWDDRGCGVCRPAARHLRPDDIKHLLVGFRLLREGPTDK